MRTLSLDLRGFGETRTLSAESGGAGASVSLLFYGLGISALVLVPLLGGTNPPETANTFHEPLIQPVTVALPPPLMNGVSAQQTSSRPPSSSAVVTPPLMPAPLSVSLGDVLDLEIGPATGIGPGSAGPGPGIGDCLVGAICGPAPLPVGNPSPKGPPRVGGLIQEPRLIESRAPLYPPIAQAAGVAGRVVLEAHVGENGRVRGSGSWRATPCSMRRPSGRCEAVATHPSF